jgi:hypothetical protein
VRLARGKQPGEHVAMPDFHPLDFQDTEEIELGKPCIQSLEFQVVYKKGIQLPSRLFGIDLIWGTIRVF